MARSTTEDPRYLRVRAKLVDALLELARTRPAEEITVSELAAAAGVARTSFYSHASSPAQLLADVLVGELRPRLATLAESMSHSAAHYVDIWRAIYLALLDHVRAHRPIYELITSGNSAVFSALISCFEEAARRYVDAIRDRLDDPPVTDLWAAMAVQQQVHNMIAVIGAWIATGMTDSPEAVVDTYMTLAPPWQLARPDESGRISLRRTRSLQDHAAVLPQAGTVPSRADRPEDLTPPDERS